MELLTYALGVWAEFGPRFIDAFVDAWHTFITNLFLEVFSFVSANPFDWIIWPIRFGLSVIIELDRLIGALTDAGFKAFYDANRSQLQRRIPKRANWQVVKQRDAITACIDCFLVEVPEAVSLEGEKVLEWSTLLFQKATKKPFIFNPTWERYVTGQLRRVLTRLFFRVLNMSLTFMKFLAMPFIFMALLSWLQKLADEKVLVTLQQETARKKVRSEQGVIRRREPGGNPP